MFPMPAEADPTGPTNLNGYLSVLRRRKWLGIAVLLLVVAAGAGWTMTRPPVYQSSVRLAIRTPLDATVAGDQRSSNPARDLRNEIEFITSDLMEKEVAKTVPNRARIDVEASEDADVVEVSATSSNATLTADTANAYAKAYVQLRITEVLDANSSSMDEINRLLGDVNQQLNDVNKPIADLDVQIATTFPGPALEELQRRRTNLATSSQARIQSLLAQQQSYQSQLASLGLRSQTIRTDGIRTLQEASVPSKPVGPNLVSNLVVAGVLGAVLAMAVVLLAEYFDDSVKSKDSLERIVAPVLGVIPAVVGWRSQDEARVVTIDQPTSPEAEAYRSLRTSVKFLGIQQSLRVLQVTSPMAGEGKTSTVANLATVLARAGEKVLVVSGDLRRPRIEKFLGVRADVGITSILLGEMSADEAIQPVEGVAGLFVLATGELVPNPSEMLAWDWTKELIEGLAEEYSLVIIDSPPVVPVTDALVTARFCDATLVVARAGQTSRRRLTRCVELLDLVEAKVIGSVLNGAQSRDDYLADDYHYGYEARVPLRGGGKGRGSRSERAEKPVSA